MNHKEKKEKKKRTYHATDLYNQTTDPIKKKKNQKRNKRKKNKIKKGRNLQHNDLHNF